MVFWLEVELVQRVSVKGQPGIRGVKVQGGLAVEPFFVMALIEMAARWWRSWTSVGSKTGYSDPARIAQVDR